MTGVLPRWYVAAGDPDLTTCPCRWGRTGYCVDGRHERCVRTWGWHRHGQPEPETYLVSRTGGARDPLWRADGTACRWLCSCVCHDRVVALIPPVERTGRRVRVGRLPISATDRQWSDVDDPQIALFGEGA